MKLTQPAEKLPTTYSTEAAGIGERLLRILICPYIVRGAPLRSVRHTEGNPKKLTQCYDANRKIVMCALLLSLRT